MRHTILISSHIDGPTENARITFKIGSREVRCCVVPGIDGRTARQKRMRERRPAVVLQGAKLRIDRMAAVADLVAFDAVDKTGRGAHGADQIAAE